MLKKSLIFGGIVVCAMLFVLAACEGPVGPAGDPGIAGDKGSQGSQGNPGNSGLIGGVVLFGGSVTADDLAAAFDATGTTVILASNVTDVYGEVPEDKTLRVLGDTAVADGQTLTLNGTLSFYSASAALHADMISSTSGGLVVDGGTITGSGKLYLPVAMDSSVYDYTTYQDVSSNKEVGSFVAGGGSATATALALAGASGIATIFGLENGPAALTVTNLTGIESTTIPAGKTLTLNGTGNTINDASFAPEGTVVNNGTVTVTTTSDAVLTSVMAKVSGVIVDDGVITTLTEAFEVPVGIDLTLSGASTFGAGDYDVTVAGTLTLGGSVTAFAPAGNVNINGGLVLETSSVITIADDKALALGAGGTVSGAGTIVAQGSGSTEGVITIGGVDYTTESGGVVGDNLADAAGYIVLSTQTLTDSALIDLDDAFGASVSGIGSVTITAASTATAVQNTAGGGSGSAVEVGSDISLAGTTLADGGGTDTLTDTEFALTIENGTEVSIADSAYSSSSPVYGVLAISGVQLKHSDLIGPELATFHIGVITGR
jgi:hypothetical protein